MIIYLAGCPGGVRKMPHRTLYSHVLFSKFIYLKRDFRWLKRRKERELQREGSKGKPARHSERGKRGSGASSKNGGA